MNHTAALFAAAVTIYYWWQNIKGIEESSGKALRIMQITTVMVVVLFIWGTYSVFMTPGAHLPPAPIPSNLKFSPEALGFLNGSALPIFGLFGILMAFGHSVLAMSGEESLAQVNREIEHPKLKNLKRAAIVIAIYSLIFTGGATLLASILIPTWERTHIYQDNLIAGLAMYMVGPMFWRIAFRIFVVLVGFLILSGAINTSMIGSTGVLMRVAEDGVLTDWFRKPHAKYGTSHRIVNMVFVLQMITILASRGNVITLGEAYAFGVIWSFTFNSLAMLVLRWKYHGERGWKVPPNLHIGRYEIPIGLLSVFLVLLSTAIVNLFTKSVATVSGLVFAATFFVIFSISERENLRKHALTARQMKDHFQLEHQDAVSRESAAIRTGGVMVTMRDAANPFALKWTLSRTNTDDQDVVVISVRMMGVGGPEYLSAEQQSFSEHEQMIFTKAVSVAESFGKKVSLLVVPAGDVFAALVQGANSLEMDSVVSGVSSKMTPRISIPHGTSVGAASRTQAPVQLLCHRSQRCGEGVLHRAPCTQSKPRRRAACSPAVVEHAPRSLGIGPASQRHHHLCADTVGGAVCSRKAGDSARSEQLSSMRRASHAAPWRTRSLDDSRHNAWPRATSAAAQILALSVNRCRNLVATSHRPSTETLWKGDFLAVEGALSRAAV